MERPGGRGNYRSPSNEEKSPSVLIYRRSGGEWAWNDHSTDEGGSCIDVLMLRKDCDAGTAIRVLHALFGIPMAPAGCDVRIPRELNTTSDDVGRGGKRGA